MRVIFLAVLALSLFAGERSAFADDEASEASMSERIQALEEQGFNGQSVTSLRYQLETAERIRGRHRDAARAWESRVGRYVTEAEGEKIRFRPVGA